MKIRPAPQWKDEGTYKEPIPSTDNVRVPRLEIDGATTYIDKDGSNNMTLTDAETGTRTLAQLAAAGTGDVTGPAASTDNMIARHSGTGGKTLQDYTSNPPTISDTGDMNVDGDVDCDNVIVSGNVDGVDVSAHAVATTGIHGAGVNTIATDDDIATHTGVAAAHHAKYTDGEAVDAAEAAGLVLADTKAIEYTTPSASHTASGVFKTKTAGTALVFGDACYTGTDGKMEKALADDAAVTVPATHLCIATIAENSTGLFLEQGEAHDDSWAFDLGLSVYLSKDTAGLITKTMPTKVTGNQVQVLGTCVVDTTTMYWNPSPIVVEYA